METVATKKEAMAAEEESAATGKYARTEFSRLSSYDRKDADFAQDGDALKYIFGKPGKKNGVELKERYAVMTRGGDGKISYLSRRNAKDAITLCADLSGRDDTDVWVGADTYMSNAKRFCAKTAFAVRSIVVDADAHDVPPEEVLDMANALLDALMDNYESLGIPLPSLAVFTGRGVQFWYGLEGTSAKLSFVASAIGERLCALYRDLLAECPITLGDFAVDTGASVRESPFFRAPGSYNPKAGCYVQALILSGDRWEINVLRETVGAATRDAGHAQRASGKRGKMTQAQLEKMRETKARSRGSLLGFLRECAAEGDYMSREVLCHVYHSLLLSYGTPREEAAEEAYAFNRTYASPLPEREIAYLIKCNEKHGYTYGWKKAIEKAGISEERSARYAEDTEILRARRRDVEARKREVVRRNEIRALRRRGLSYSEIARRTGRNFRTVRKYADEPMECVGKDGRIHEAGPDDDAALPDPEEARARVRKACRSGFRSIEKIAALAEVGKETAEEYANEYWEERRLLRETRSYAWMLRGVRKGVDECIRKLPGEEFAGLRRPLWKLDRKCFDLLNELDERKKKNRETLDRIGKDVRDAKKELARLTLQAYKARKSAMQKSPNANLLRGAAEQRPNVPARPVCSSRGDTPAGLGSFAASPGLMPA